MKLHTSLEWGFFSVSALQAALVTALQITVLVRYLDWVNPVVYQVPVSYVVPLTLAVSLLGCYFQVVVTLDSCRIKNTIQIWVQCIINICLSVAAGMQYLQAKDAVDRIIPGHDMYGTPFAKLERPFWKEARPLLLGCLAVFSACSLLMCILACYLHVEFAWSLYEHISPDVKMKARHQRYQAYLVFLKVEVLFVILFVLIYGLIQVHYQQPEFGLTMAIIPTSLIHGGLATHFMRSENKKGVALIVAVHLGIVAYLISRLVLLLGDGVVSRSWMKGEMILLAVFGLTFNAVSSIAAVVCALNFDKGLKPLLQGQAANQPAAYEAEMSDLQNPSIPIAPPERVSRRFNID
ncbi:hypothetical protein FDECE_17911 [Fusarium decemcellulare]|nr:hypothetical protein FDECE_17911 [Fusarium decemcellulare]